ncbi:isochorismatase family protein [Pseudoroseomonas wenyumeiae]
MPQAAAGFAPESVLRPAVTLPARPEPLRLRASETALIIVDMQNAYASAGGYLDLAGFDVSGAEAAIAAIAKAAEAARAVGIPVFYFQNGWDAGYAEAGGPGSPNWHKSNALKTMRKRPELEGRFLAKGGWDYALVDALAPQPGDFVVSKTRYSGFFNTNMDSLLRARGIRNLIFTGIATNVCVESAARCLPPGILPGDAGGRDAPRGARLHPEGHGLQRGDLLRLGVHRGRFLRRHRPAAIGLKEKPPCP